MKDRQHININIAGYSFQLESSESEEAIRSVETDINKMWSKWCEDFRDMSQQQVLAMVAFQYARFYHSLSQMVQANELAIDECERRLDNILLNVD